jgi:hypothetical protein
MSIALLGATVSPGAPALVFGAAIRAEIGPAVEFDAAHGGGRALFPISGGVIAGEGLDGRILSGGADVARRLPGGAYAVDARYAVAFADGTVAMIRNAGRMVPRPDGSFAGRPRAAFDAPPGPYAWLADAVFFGTARVEPRDEARVFIELWEAVL